MKYILVFCTVLLSGCFGTVPVKQKFPEAPPTLLEKCKSLNTIDKPQVLLSEFMGVVTRNYTKYHDCAALVDAWQEWYTSQKKIADEVK
jgi:hypothetical protein